MIYEFLRKTFVTEKKFESVIFWSVLAFCFMASIFSAAFTSFQNIGMLAVVSCFLIAIFFIILAAIAQKTKKIRQCYFAMCIAIDTIILPPCFLICGGFRSGMTLYFLTAILVNSLYSKPKGRAILTFYAIVAFESIFHYVWFNPDSVVFIKDQTMISDIMVSFFLMALLINTIVSFLLKAYNKESSDKDKLIKELNFLSTHDPLTSLLNRRCFMKHFTEIIWPERKGFYLLMYDIDFFKKINDTMGHKWGDNVLKKVSEVAKLLRKKDEGEIAVRYGGEEFIQVIKADNIKEARKRAEDLRTSISSLVFDGYPDLRVTISGGLVDCCDEQFLNHEMLLSKADELLYLAKSNGRNLIVDKK